MIENVHVDLDYENRAAVGWSDGSFRYQYWVKLPALEPEDRVIYKNPIVRQPGDFRTLRLNYDAASNRRTIAAVKAAVETEDLVRKASDARDRKRIGDVECDAMVDAWFVQARAFAKAGPDLLRALKRWQRFAADNGWTDQDYHDADGRGWISDMTDAITTFERAC